LDENLAIFRPFYPVSRNMATGILDIYRSISQPFFRHATR